MKHIIHQLIKTISKQLINTSQPNQEALWLLEELTQQKKLDLLLNKEINLNKKQEAKLNNWIIERTKQNKPLQYIIGYVDFCKVKIKVKPSILIPRPETEEWCAWLIEKLKAYKNNKIRILDLCCGSGCIGIAIAKTYPIFQITGVDINTKAIDLSQKNAQLNKVKNIKFIKSDLYSNLKTTDKFNLIISNPPYILKSEWEGLQPEVKQWEDPSALIAKNKGLDIYFKIINKAKRYLSCTNDKIFTKSQIPQIVLEVTNENNESIKNHLLELNYKNIKVYKDLSKKQRWISANLLTFLLIFHIFIFIF